MLLLSVVLSIVNIVDNSDVAGIASFIFMFLAFAVTGFYWLGQIPS
jgi:hypothetical protein